MKIGACGSVMGLTYPYAKELGFDYMEIPFRDLGKITEEEFQAMLEKAKEIDFPITKANVMIPGDYKLFGEEARTDEELKAFLEKGFSRAKQLGIELVVWGSGASRKYENIDDAVAYKRLIEIGKIVSDIAKKYDILVVIEPLQKGETNVFNTVKETSAYVRDLNCENVLVLADSFHMMAESEKYDTLKDNKDLIVHAHIAEAKFGSNEIRLVPNLADENNVKEFVDELKKIGYKGDISIEASLRSGDWKNDMAEGLKALKSWI